MKILKNNGDVLYIFEDNKGSAFMNDSEKIIEQKLFKLQELQSPEFI